MTNIPLRRHLFLLLLLLINLCSLTAQYVIKSKYPEWFLYPAENKEIIVGFGSLNVHAKYHAAVRHDILSSCTVSGFLEEYSETRIDLKINKNYYYFYNESKVDSTYPLLNRVDVMYTNVLNDESIQAFTIRDTVGHVFKIIHVEDLNRPNWLEQNVWFSDGYINSKGRYYTDQSSENATWMNSEENAILNALLFNSQTLVSSSIYHIKNNSEDLKNYLATIISFSIRNIEIIQRYPDIENGIYYTWIKIKPGNISNELTD